VRNSSILLAAALTLAPACAADTDRDDEGFNRKRGLSIDIPPPPSGDEALPKADDRGLRISQGLTVEEAEQIALEANPNMTVAAEIVSAAKANIWQQSILTNPVLTLTSDGIPMQGARQTPYAGASGPSLAYTPFNGGLFSDPQNGIINDRPRAWDPRYSKLSAALQKDFDVSLKRVARVDNAIESEQQAEAQYASAARLVCVLYQDTFYDPPILLTAQTPHAYFVAPVTSTATTVSIFIVQDGLFEAVIPANPPPVIASITPSESDTAAGVTCVITGSGFQQGAKVTLNGVPQDDVQVLSPTTITFINTPQYPITVDLRVYNSDGGKGEKFGAFTYHN